MCVWKGRGRKLRPEKCAEIFKRFSPTAMKGADTLAYQRERTREQSLQRGPTHMEQRAAGTAHGGRLHRSLLFIRTHLCWKQAEPTPV